MPHPPSPIAELGMYPFASVRWAWDALWELTRERAAWIPPELAHSGDVHARWNDPACVVNHICGWPLAHDHAADQRPVGAFELTIPEVDGHRYRASLVSRHDATLEQLTQPDTVAAVNGFESLSGWISLVHATVGAGGSWPGSTRVTGSHVASLEALADGDADVASIDSWSLALIAGERPELVDALHRVGRGPLVPSPPITVRATVPEIAGGQLGAALAAAVDDPASAPIRAALLIDAFVPVTIDDYLPVLELMRERR